MSTADRWRIEITSKDTNLREGTAGYLVITTGSPVKVYSFVGTRQTIVGRDIPITAYAFDGNTSDDLSVPSPLDGAIRSINGEVISPNGSIQKITFGNSQDVFTSVFRPQTAGQYQVRIEVEGVTPEGEAFIRTSEQIIQVISDSGSIGKSAYSTQVDGTRLQVNIPVNGSSKRTTSNCLWRNLCARRRINRAGCLDWRNDKR